MILTSFQIKTWGKVFLSYNRTNKQTDIKTDLATFTLLCCFYNCILAVQSKVGLQRLAHLGQPIMYIGRACYTNTDYRILLLINRIGLIFKSGYCWLHFSIIAHLLYYTIHKFFLISFLIFRYCFVVYFLDKFEKYVVSKICVMQFSIFIVFFNNIIQ